MSDILPSGPTFLLFVYGTLKQGGVRHGPLAGQFLRGLVTTRPRYALHDLGAYPGLVESAEDGQAVEGELYEVDRRLLSYLEAVEGAPTLFSLGMIEIEGVSEPVFAYYYRRGVMGRPRVRSGKWENRPGKGA
jgi:gamma-glutamylcyclotransferase (GGCT)/AIG2-like uncharacterized protein YtfP